MRLSACYNIIRLAEQWQVTAVVTVVDGNSIQDRVLYECSTDLCHAALIVEDRVADYYAECMDKYWTVPCTTALTSLLLTHGAPVIVPQQYVVDAECLSRIAVGGRVNLIGIISYNHNII